MEFKKTSGFRVQGFASFTPQEPNGTVPEPH